MRNISFMLTVEQIRARTKTVTRRTGWHNALPGDRLQGVVKAQGLAKGQKVEKLAAIVLRDVRHERLDRMLTEPEYGRAEVVLEGFPDMTPEEFVAMFCKSHGGIHPSDVVTRLEFGYVG